MNINYNKKSFEFIRLKNLYMKYNLHRLFLLYNSFINVFKLNNIICLIKYFSKAHPAKLSQINQ